MSHIRELVFHWDHLDGCYGLFSLSKIGNFSIAEFQEKDVFSGF